jgi:two-component system chemotaxis sensor kinase CheA
MDNFRKKFIEEAQDLLTELENVLLSFTPDSVGKDHIEHIFRIMHTLKGNSAMFGFIMIDQYTHRLENIYDLVRNGKKVFSQSLMDLTLSSVDHLRNLLDEENSTKPEVQSFHAGLLQQIDFIVSDGIEATVDERSCKTSSEEKIKTFYIHFKPHQGILLNGTNPLFLIEDFGTVGDFLVIPDTKDIPSFTELDPEKCYTSWEIILSTKQDKDKISEIFIFAEDACDLEILELSAKDLVSDPGFAKMIADAALESSHLGIQKIREFISGPVVVKKPEPGINTFNDVSNKLKNISSIRVSSEKLDELINLVSELVTTQAGLSLAAEKINSKELHVLAEDVEKLTRKLRDSTFDIRLIPIENMITRFHRLVRELSHTLKKDITFVTEGTNIELDKNIIEGLIDPVMHIIRNSADHGIETAEERKKSGKPGTGIITFSAYHSGSNVFIRISDDGKGINPEKIFRSAVSKGLVSADAILQKKEILDLLFIPGFSTAENVTSISGRGVGMDVVKKKICDLRGEVSIESEPEKGTSIILKLPLTLSIIDGLLVEIEDSKYVIPLSSVHKCFEFRHDVLTHAVNNLLFVNDGHIPFIYLRNEFDIKTTSPQQEQVVVIEYGDMHIGLAVDKVIGEYQAVLKSLGLMYRKQDLISGATILGDGTVALVLDPNRIIAKYNYQKAVS